MRGDGTTVEEVKIKRNIIHTSSVPYSGYLNGRDGIGYVALSTFSQSSYAEVRAAVEAMQREKELKGIVLDLRGNGGGVLQEAVKILSLFVDRGTAVVSVKGREGSAERVMKTIGEPIAKDVPIVVLVDRASASASEVVSGAIQDLDRGLIVGQRTFGKGLVQSTVSLGSGSTLKLTTAKYYTPSGRCIQAIDFSSRNEDGSVGVTLTHLEMNLLPRWDVKFMTVEV